MYFQYYYCLYLIAIVTAYCNIHRLVVDGFKTPLKEEHVYDIPPSIVSDNVMEPFLQNWVPIYEKFKKTKM